MQYDGHEDQVHDVGTCPACGESFGPFAELMARGWHYRRHEGTCNFVGADTLDAAAAGVTNANA